MLELFRSKRRAFVWLTEAALVLSLLLVAADLRPSLGAPLLPTIDLVAKAALATLVVQASLYYFGLYADEPIGSPARVVARFARALGASAVVLFLAYYVVRPIELGAGTVLLGLGLAAVVLPTWRAAYEALAENPSFARRVLVLGDGDLARDIADIVRTRPLGMQLVGLLRRPGEAHGELPRDVIGSYEDLMTVAAWQGIDAVIVADADRRGTLPVDQLLALKFNGIAVEEGVEFYERTTGKIHVREIKPSQFIFADGFDGRPGARRLKRMFDVVVAALGLVVAAPIMLATAIAIRLESKGPALYRQVRVGELGRSFSILKFRSMRVDAEKDGPRWASANDARVTRVGALIRKTRLDELPQLWNVLRGDMSLVGPRPERPVFVADLEKKVPFFRQRLYVKPGVTGHAQVRCRYAASVEDSLEKLQYDLYYIKSQSLAFDLSILFDTLKVVLLKIGAR